MRHVGVLALLACAGGCRDAPAPQPSARTTAARVAPAKAVARDCGPGGACASDVAPGLREVVVALGWPDLPTESRGAGAGPEVRIWWTRRPADRGRVLRVVGPDSTAAGEVLSWAHSSPRDTQTFVYRSLTTGAEHRQVRCPAQFRRGALTICPGARRGPPYAGNLLHVLGAAGAWQLSGDATPADTVFTEEFGPLEPGALVVEVRDAAGRYRTFGYNRGVGFRTGTPAAVQRLLAAVDEWQQ